MRPIKLTQWLALMSAIVLFSCSSVKQAARKDDAAVERVTASKSLLAQVEPAVKDIFPCDCDSSVVYKPGKIDSVPYPVYIGVALDSTELSNLKATLQAQTSRERSLIDSAYKAGFAVAVRQMRDVKIPVKTPDTAQYTIRSTDTEKRLQLQLAQEQKKTTAAETKAQIYMEDRTKLIWALVIAIILLVLTNAMWIRFKFFK